MSGGHPIEIAPLVVHVPYDGGRQRRVFGVERKRVSLVCRIPVVARDDVVLIMGSFPNPPEKPFPDSGSAVQMQEMLRFGPSVEVAHHRNLLGVRCPHGEMGSLHAIQNSGMSPQPLIEMEMRALIEEVDVFIAE